ncbi:hypothetical protein HBI56_238350 [Parastagonospora nodorum]|nr:hypothetical protein HBH53_063750 [Parastagonospora nodorum]KAH3979450.1 hypothetical protein HBH52_103140 [Parastagonospora nodorum]KAH3999480.1 hypothetical protein HBI10_111010 [Parastagonospora nodorum]KAH4014533.1 hypothetical protein HBI13_167340 [Parastagonospora nodorum]KAH4078710.1 hypothetical protein HBH46_236410 [Parastagonospora nodorum]
MEDTSNLSIYARTLTKRVLFDGTLAVGAVVDRNGSEVALMASKEVIICAGTFQSPQLLMASGIGPHETLKRFNITVVSELEGVGQNLEDHLLFGASYHVTPITHSALSNATFLARAISEYAKNGTGILSNPGGEVLAWERLNPTAEGLSDYARDAIKSRTPDWPTFEFLMLDAYSGNNQNYITGAPDTPFMYASPAGAILVQQSRGNITISSIDTAVPPVINPNWLTHPADQELSLLAFKRLREMMNTDAMKGVWVEEVLPGLNVSSDEGILDAIRETAIQLFHAACTCKMGKSPESGAVVDARGRVFGTQSLRIVDASVLPFLPPGHPQATVYALAAKIAKDIIDLRG